MSRRGGVRQGGAGADRAVPDRAVGRGAALVRGAHRRRGRSVQRHGAGRGRQRRRLGANRGWRSLRRRGEGARARDGHLDRSQGARRSRRDARPRGRSDGGSSVHGASSDACPGHVVRGARPCPAAATEAARGTPRDRDGGSAGSARAAGRGANPSLGDGRPGRLRAESPRSGSGRGCRRLRGHRVRHRARLVPGAAPRAPPWRGAATCSRARRPQPSRGSWGAPTHARCDGPRAAPSRRAPA